MGNHWGSISSDKTTKKTDGITMLHFPIRGLDHFTLKTKKSCQAFEYDKKSKKGKGNTATMGKHWKNDYDLVVAGGPEQAFRNKYLTEIDDTLVRFRFFAEEKIDKMK
jgi:hypothetical protein